MPPLFRRLSATATVGYIEYQDARTAFENYMADQKYCRGKHGSFVKHMQNVIYNLVIVQEY